MPALVAIILPENDINDDYDVHDDDSNDDSDDDNDGDNNKLDGVCVCVPLWFLIITHVQSQPIIRCHGQSDKRKYIKERINESVFGLVGVVY